MDIFDKPSSNISEFMDSNKYHTRDNAIECSTARDHENMCLLKWWHTKRNWQRGM